MIVSGLDNTSVISDNNNKKLSNLPDSEVKQTKKKEKKV